jgi:hypothetical protein
MYHPMKSIFVFVLLGFVLTRAPGETTTIPKHLAEARLLLSGVTLDRTNYEHGQPNVTWEEPKASHTDCSGFIDALFMHTYQYDPAAYKRWFDSHRPSAKRYHDAIVEHKGFTQLQRVADIRPGDIIAVKYLKRTDNTGHVMLADSMATSRKATDPIVEGTQQWELTIIDSSKSGHGVTDTRHKMGADGKDHDGLGRGVLRLYTHADGSIAGFAWSTLKVSEFKMPDTEDLVVGRLLSGYRP